MAEINKTINHKMTTKSLGKIVENMADADYRAAAGINISALKRIGESPQKYKFALAHKSRPTPAQVFGTLLHAKCLEPNRELYVVKPEGMTFVTKEGKAWRAEQTLPILTQEEDDTISGCCNSVLSNKLVAGILSQAKTEVTVFKETEFGTLKGRIDILASGPDGYTVYDLKTTESCDPNAFRASIEKWGYGVQAAFYADLIGVDEFRFIAVEKEPPFAINFFVLGKEELDFYRVIYMDYLKVLHECTQADNWPGYGDYFKPLNTSKWKYTNSELHAESLSERAKNWKFNS